MMAEEAARAVVSTFMMQLALSRDTKVFLIEPILATTEDRDHTAVCRSSARRNKVQDEPSCGCSAVDHLVG
jgi:hypothetical protein